MGAEVTALKNRRSVDLCSALHRLGGSEQVSCLQLDLDSVLLNAVQCYLAGCLAREVY